MNIKIPIANCPRRIWIFIGAEKPIGLYGVIALATNPIKMHINTSEIKCAIKVYVDQIRELWKTKTKTKNKHDEEMIGFDWLPSRNMKTTGMMKNIEHHIPAPVEAVFDNWLELSITKLAISSINIININKNITDANINVKTYGHDKRQSISLGDNRLFRIRWGYDRA